MQGTPQLPQSVSVSSEVSHPSPGMPLQLPQPTVQAPTPQRPPLHAAVAFAGAAQVTPHALQSVRVPSGVSQPLAGPQSAQPSSHAATRQVPPAQLGVAWSIAQARPQAPQWARLFKSISQPFRGLTSQFS